MLDGFQNEENFKNLLDHKKVKDLPKNMQQLLQALFQEISMESFVYCWRSKYLEKADIKIKIENVIKGISIKSGHQCSIHQEHKNKFYKFLLKIGVDNKIVSLFDEFMIGEVNKKKVSSKIYIMENQEKINRVRIAFNDYYVKINLIMRFLFQGTEIQNYDCDAIIYGTPSDFIWATKNEILKYLVEYNSYDNQYIAISALNIKCYDRNLRNNPLKIINQEKIQIKWYSLKEDILDISSKRHIGIVIDKYIKK